MPLLYLKQPESEHVWILVAIHGDLVLDITKFSLLRQHLVHNFRADVASTVYSILTSDDTAPLSSHSQ